VWSPDGTYILYSSQRGGSRTLWKVSTSNGDAVPILTGSGDDDYPDVSADGSRLVFSNRRERFSLMRNDVRTGQQEILLESRQMLIAPELSPDRKLVAFSSLTRSGGVHVFTLPLSGGTPLQVTSDPLATYVVPRWSSDGRQIYFYYTGDAKAFGKVDATGGEAEVVVPGWEWSVSNGASVSPDGTQVVYSRLTGQVPVQTLLRDLRTGDDRAFYATLEYPRWSQSGTHIIGALHTDQSFPGDVARCPVTELECRIIARDARIPMFSASEAEIYFVRGFGVSQELFVTSANGAGEERHVLTMAPLFPLGPFYDITKNGDVVWVRFELEPSDIWLAELSDW
jgi:Tol biopolymer transport system component